MDLESWKSQGVIQEFGGLKIFSVEGPHDGVPLVFLHGFPSASYDLHRCWDKLTERFHVFAHDHVGFGYSDKPENYSYSLVEQTDFALQIWRRAGIREAHVVAHDYGTSIATELLAREIRGLLDFKVKSLTLSNGSMHVELAGLRPIQRLLLNKYAGPLVAKMSSKGTFLRNMHGIWGKQNEPEQEDLDALWELLIRDGGKERLPAISQYIFERKKFWHRWIGALEETTIPVHVLWGDADPVARIAIAHRLCGEISQPVFTCLEGVGHYPMLEAPEDWAEACINYCLRFN